MPIKRCTLSGGGSGFKYGDSGKCYASKKDAIKQMMAIKANGYTGAALNKDEVEVTQQELDEVLDEIEQTKKDIDGYFK